MNDERKAINSIMDIAGNQKISRKPLSLESNANCKFTRLLVFGLLLVFPLFMVKNAFHYYESFCLRFFFFVALMYLFKGKMKNARELMKLIQTRKEIRYSRRLLCYYEQAEAELSGIKLKLFFYRRTRNGDWTGLMTTNTKLNFLEAYHVYSMRWSIEVFLKETKSLLGLRISQAWDFTSQIASISIMVLQYNIQVADRPNAIPVSEQDAHRKLIQFGTAIK